MTADGEAAERDDDAGDSEAADSSVFATTSPLDGSELEPVTATPVEQIAELVTRAAEAQRQWAETPLVDRVDALAGIKGRILGRAEEIAELLNREVGKPVEEAALAEVLPNADLVDYWVDSIEELLEGAPVDLDPLSYPSKSGRIHQDPRGLIALITPWNYPVAIPLRTLIPALLAGNAVLFKPSEVTPRCGALVASLFEDLLPDGLLTLVQGGAEVGEALVAADIDQVVFTGSVPTGRTIAMACAERLLPCSLELGGKDAAIVMKDCNLERTAQGLVWGAFTNAGQNCAAIERVYVDKSIADKLIERIVAITKKLRPRKDTAMVTTAEQCVTVRRHLAEATDCGVEVLVGGEPDDEEERAFPPTVMKVQGGDDEAAFMRDETFGPLLPIVVVDDVDEAIERANRSRYALTTSIWTKRLKHAHELARRLRSGVVTVNNHGFTAALPAAPWTGVGDSGGGITGSRHALSAFTRVRFVLEDRSGAKRELWWYPYTPALRTIVFAMAKLRGGAGIFGRLVALWRLITAFPKRMFGKG